MMTAVSTTRKTAKLIVTSHQLIHLTIIFIEDDYSILRANANLVFDGMNRIYKIAQVGVGAVSIAIPDIRFEG